MNENIILIIDLDDVQLDGIGPQDDPEFSDAYVAFARWKSTGEALTEEELYRIDPNAAIALAVLRSLYN